MPEANHAHYAGKSHQQLYNELMAGKPGQVHAQAATLSSLYSMVDDMSNTLDRDLFGLGLVWQSASGQEYTRRVGAIVSFSGSVAGGFDNMQSGLTVMADQLQTAQSQAESPDKVDTNNMVEDAAIGGVLFGAPGAIIGGWMGHNKDEEAKKQAHNQMVNLVAGLAGQYQVGGTNFTPAPSAPDGLPGGGSGGHGSAAGGPGGPGVRSGTGLLGVPGGGQTRPADSGGVTPVSSVTPVDSSTALLGAGGALAGSGALSATALNAMRGAGGTGTGLAADGPTGAGRAGSGVIGAEDDVHRSGAAGARAARPAGAPEEPEGAGRANRAAMSGSGNRSALVGRTGETAEDEADERMTWLVEDEMVWGASDAPGHGALGAPQTPTEG
jgi:hypothetical protein